MFEKIKNGFITGFSFAAGVISMTLLAVTVGNVNTFNAGEPLSSSKLNENFSSLKTAIESLNTEVSTFKTSVNTDVETLRTSINTVNTELGSTKTDLSTTQTSFTSASTTLQAVDTTLSGRVAALETNLASVSSVPVGTIIAYGAESPPSGWLLCDGRVYNVIDYKALHDIILNRFGGDGNTTFNVPDFRGRFLRGWDNGAGRDPDISSRIAMNMGGLSTSGIGSIQDDELKSHNHTIGISPVTNPNSDYYMHFAAYVIGTMSTSSTGGYETRPKNAYVNFIIKY